MLLRQFIDLVEIIHEDVFMRKFYQSLYIEPRLWLRNLKVDSIESWADLHDAFLRYWVRTSHMNNTYLVLCLEEGEG
jgi:hypothetical protein